MKWAVALPSLAALMRMACSPEFGPNENECNPRACVSAGVLGDATVGWRRQRYGERYGDHGGVKTRHVDGGQTFFSLPANLGTCIGSRAPISIR